MITIADLKASDYRILPLEMKGFMIVECRCGCGSKRLYRIIMQDRLVRMKRDDLLQMGVLSTYN